MSVETKTIDSAREEGFAPYRAVSKAAVVSLVLGLASVVGLASATLLVLALVGFVLGLIGWRSIVRYPAELTGKPMAILGVVLSAMFFVVGASKHMHEYATEVPEGYERISFRELQPEKGSRMPIPPGALELSGQQVFVKGYLYPDGQQDNIQRFVLIPDLGTCCFGGQPKLTDMIEVTLEEPLRVSYSMRKRKFAGLLKVDPRLKPVSGVNGVYYQLQADFLR
ncbi:MAG: hypothetical protein CMJ64_11915 [Planctomycetaceae bacterium]|nr:hypothetical protein [Planctomycetaceae bacterium]